jgi:hypothetical protein
MDYEVQRPSSRRWILLVGILVTIGTLLLAQPSLAQLPTRPGLDSPTGDHADGAQLVLLVQFPQGWPWESTHWQELWTVVQWQDPHTGQWHTVEGWQGTLDTVEVDKAELVTGKKTWWVGEGELGKGPFRWLVCKGQGGSPLTTSTVFDLPDAAGTSATVVVAP